jgi:hypothetical protein
MPKMNKTKKTRPHRGEAGPLGFRFENGEKIASS